IDLKFPHHENEIAQSETCNGKTFANFWVHNEFLNMGKDKMSKSLGNVVLVHDLLKDWDGEVIRLALLKAHYRNELVWSEDLLRESKAQLDKWYRVKANLVAVPKPRLTSLFVIFNKDFSATTFNAIYADLQTPKWFAGFSDLNEYRRYALDEMKRYVDHGEYAEMPKYDEYLIDQALVDNLNILGFLRCDPEDWFRGDATADDLALVERYDAVRAEALAAKERGDKAAMGAAFQQSDAIRDELKASGFVIETGPDGSTLRKA
ncbi:MAG: hypothetical protein AAF926_07065, partial [Pseudomonadota bacterium]